MKFKLPLNCQDLQGASWYLEQVLGERLICYPGRWGIFTKPPGGTWDFFGPPYFSLIQFQYSNPQKNKRYEKFCMGPNLTIRGDIMSLGGPGKSP